MQKGPVRPAVGKERLDAVAAELGVVFPADLRAWWALTDVSADFWIPGAFAPVSLEEALETRETWLLVAEQEDEIEEAGEHGGGHSDDRFLPELMPVALGTGGDGLVVDLRDGEAQGAVHLWDHERWGLGVPLWRSTGAMLRDVAVALEAGSPALLEHVALGCTEAPLVRCFDESGDLNWVALGDV